MPVPATLLDTTLANGLRVLILPDHKTPVFTFQVWYKVGSRNEGPGLTGVSHLCEHMMFKGTGTVGKGEYSRTIQRHGGNFNAFTTPDLTAYYEHMAIDKLEREFQKAINQMVADEVYGCESVAQQARELAQAVTTGDLSLFFDYLDRLKAVTPEDCRRVANTYLLSRNCTIATLLDKTLDPSEQLAGVAA